MHNDIIVHDWISNQYLYYTILCFVTILLYSDYRGLQGKVISGLGIVNFYLESGIELMSK